MKKMLIRIPWWLAAVVLLGGWLLVSAPATDCPRLFFV
jgi:hypothetical protein